MLDLTASVRFFREGECPVFPGITRHWHIPFPDPSAVSGTPERKLAQVREIRDAIKAAILNPSADAFDFHRFT